MTETLLILIALTLVLAALVLPFWQICKAYEQLAREEQFDD